MEVGGCKYYLAFHLLQLIAEDTLAYHMDFAGLDIDSTLWDTR